MFTDDAETAWSVQGVDLPATARLSGVAPASEEFTVGIGGMGRGGDVTVVLDVPAGAEPRFGYVHAVGRSREAAIAAYEAVAADVGGASGIRAVLERAARGGGDAGEQRVLGPPAGARDDVRTTSRLYWWGILGILYFRRDYAGNVLGRSYDTLMPNYWATTTFLWDFSLSSVDARAARPRRLCGASSATGSRATAHTLFGTSSLTGGPVGQWYSVNDYAMTRLVRDYVRFTGDAAFLDEEQGDGRSVLDHLRFWASRVAGPAPVVAARRLWRDREPARVRQLVHARGRELQCGERLEPALTADVLESRGDVAGAAELRAEADELVAAVLEGRPPGQGFFAAGQPDGTKTPGAALLRLQHRRDDDPRGRSTRPPARRWSTSSGASCRRQSGSARSRLGSRRLLQRPARPPVERRVHRLAGGRGTRAGGARRAEVALDWLPGLARTANQGPPGQAHFVAEAQPLLSGGARKAPPQLPYINDWACSSSGAYVALVIESLFGAAPGIDGLGEVNGCVAELDPARCSAGSRVGDRLVDVHADGRVVDRA